MQMRLRRRKADFGKERCTAMANKEENADGYYALVG